MSHPMRSRIPTILRKFRPTQLSGNTLWLKASNPASITESLDLVSQWNDLTVNSNHATQGIGINQPTTGAETQNSKNTLDFPGSPVTMAIPNLGFDGLAAVTLFFVMYLDSASSFDNPLAFGSGSEGRFETSGAGGDVIKSVGLGFRSSDANLWAGSVDDVYNIYTLHTDGTTVTAHLNGAPEYSQAQQGNWTTGAGDYGIMASNTPNRHATGKMAEIIAYNRDLPPAEVAQVERYLATEWGISI